LEFKRNSDESGMKERERGDGSGRKMRNKKSNPEMRGGSAE